jgi:dTDP-glucose 4,6-dehydratase
VRLLITGGSGFIGSAVVRRAVALGISVVNVDKLTYAATEGSTREVVDSERYVLEVADVMDTDAISNILARHRPDRVMHLAAESHVDRSIDRPLDFVLTNVVGTASMLSAAFAYYETLSGESRDRFRFHHISTDEVFGTLGPTGTFTLESPYDPRSPYSASKAGADHLARAWHHTYGLPVVVSNCSNNYGPYQFPEKLIPLIIIRALNGLSLPVYGAGENIRDWLFVEDHAEALLKIVESGDVETTYLIGGGAERRNIDVVRQICSTLDHISPLRDGQPHDQLIEFVEDRPGHDRRYAIDNSDTIERLGWSPRMSFDDGLHATIEWYMANAEWWEPLASGGFAVERAGLARGTGKTA